MMSGSARLSLPFLSPGQAQKEWYHNEALQTLDLLVAAAVEEAPRNDPPASPMPGACFIVGSSPAGAWQGQNQCIAGFTSGGWRMIAPAEGMTAYVKDSSTWAAYRAGGWEVGALRGVSLVLDGLQVVGSRAAAIPGPTGGSSADAEGRAVIDQILAVLRHHGLIES